MYITILHFGHLVNLKKGISLQENKQKGTDIQNENKKT